MEDRDEVAVACRTAYQDVYNSVCSCYPEFVKSASRTPANVRISPHAHELLRQLAKEEEESMQAVLDKAIEHYRREKFLRDANADFAALRRNSKAWKEELRERELWEQTLADGLAKE
jgi:hypothetical protein